MDCQVFGVSIAVMIWLGVAVMIGAWIAQWRMACRVRRIAAQATGEMDAFWTDLNNELAARSEQSQEPAR